MAPFYLNPLLKDPISKDSHSEVLEVQASNIGIWGDTIQPPVRVAVRRRNSTAASVRRPCCEPGQPVVHHLWAAGGVGTCGWRWDPSPFHLKRWPGLCARGRSPPPPVSASVSGAALHTGALGGPELATSMSWAAVGRGEAGTSWMTVPRTLTRVSRSSLTQCPSERPRHTPTAGAAPARWPPRGSLLRSNSDNNLNAGAPDWRGCLRGHPPSASRPSCCSRRPARLMEPAKTLGSYTPGPRSGRPRSTGWVELARGIRGPSSPGTSGKEATWAGECRRVGVQADRGGHLCAWGPGFWASGKRHQRLSRTPAWIQPGR